MDSDVGAKANNDCQEPGKYFVFAHTFLSSRCKDKGYLMSAKYLENARPDLFTAISNRY
jgi:hypothetical protein